MRATIREVTAADLDAVTELWAAAEAARKAEAEDPTAETAPTEEVDPAAGSRDKTEDDDIAERVARRLRDPTAFGVVAEVTGQLAALAVATQATADDGLGFEPVAGLAHVSMVAVRPERWGSGLGRHVAEKLEGLARDRGFSRAQLWTHETNTRGRRLYEQLGWLPSGRTKQDERGAVLRHYVRRL